MIGGRRLTPVRPAARNCESHLCAVNQYPGRLEYLTPLDYA